MTSTNISDLPYTTPPVAAAPQPTVKLPERDIPRETIQHTVDPQANVQYMPPRQMDYIPAAPVQASKWDYAKLYDEFRVPIMIALLYFVFQLQSFQDLIKKFIPALFSESGQLTSKGTIFKSALFGSAYYSLTLVMQHLSRP
jgi:hypothetical protein